MERSRALLSVPPLVRVRQVSLLVFWLVLLSYSVTVGVPVDRVQQTLWIVAGIWVAGIGRPWRQNVRVFLDWIPFIALLLAYDRTRGVADTLGMPVHVGWPIDVDRWLTGGTVPTVWLQDHLYDPGRQEWWDVVAALTYASHFVLPWLLAALLYVRARPEWLWYARRVIALSAAGLLTYVLLPAAPPWLASAQGEIDSEVVRISARGWSAVGMRGARVLIERAQFDVNIVAALPSLHAAFALLVALTLWRYVRSVVGRVLLLAYPLAMGFSLVYGGEHYVVDVLLGWVYVVLILVVVALAERWWGAVTSKFLVWQATHQALSGDGLIRPDEHPQALSGHGDGRLDAFRGEPAAYEIGVGVTPGSGDGDE